MNNKFQIIETYDYWLAVSDEEIKEGDIVISKFGDVGGKVIKYLPDSFGYSIDEKTRFGFNENKNWSILERDCKKIIAYQPKGKAPELDLPLLPEIVVEDDMDKLANNLANEQGGDDPILRGHIYASFIEGFDSATKIYTEEDLRKAIEIGEKCIILNSRGSYLESKQLKESFIQSLKQPKTKWFVAETITINKGYTDKNDYPYQECEVLKTTTNEQGQKVLAGKYK